MSDPLAKLDQLNAVSAATPPEFSDDAIAMAFSEKSDGHLLHVAAWGHWLRWDGQRWALDDTLRVFDLVRRRCRATAATALNNKVAKQIASAGTISAVERIARSDARHARRSDDFDADPWLLNTAGGVVDLRTGNLRPHQPTDLFTKVTAVAPGGKCPRWRRFLRQVTGGDRELIRYLQRFIGYTLTGSTREHAFIFLWGPGGNGKSVLLETLRSVLGDYATVAMADVFLATRTEQHSTNVAALRGARLVVVPEIEENREWAESRIKSMTAGDRVTARAMRGDPFEFTPAFKLWIAGNQRPALRNPDEAMKRRMNMVPMTFRPKKVDEELAEKLKAEWPGILAWAIEGCRAWQREGLKPPKVVTEATEEYFIQQDTIRNWFVERCEMVEGVMAGSRALYQDWRKWAEFAGEEPGTEKAFSANLERLVPKKRVTRGVVFIGVRLVGRSVASVAA